MGRFGVILAVGAASVCAAFAGAASAETSQGGCQGYGAFVSTTAQSLNGAETPGGASSSSGRSGVMYHPRRLRAWKRPWVQMRQR